MTTIIIYLKETWVLDDGGWHSPYEVIVWKGRAYQSPEQMSRAHAQLRERS